MSECEGGTAVAIQVVPRLWQLSAVAATPALSPSLTSVVADGADALVDDVSTPFVNLPARLRPTDQSHTVPTLPFVSSSAGLAVRRAICERGCRWHWEFLKRL